MKQKQKVIDAKTGTRDIKLERQIEASLLALEDQRAVLKKELAANGGAFDAKKCP